VCILFSVKTSFDIIMSVRKAFEDGWHDKFPESPVPANLSFLDDEGVSSLATVLDSTERTMKKMEAELSRQRFIHEFVLQQLNASIAARSDYASRHSVPPSQQLASDERQKTPVSKTPSAPRPGQQVRNKPSQFAAVMAKIGIGKVNRPAIDPEDEGSLDESGSLKKATPLSRFYEKSNMYRASSEPSLLDSQMKFKPQPAIPPTTTSRMPPGFKPIFTKDEHSRPLTSLSTGNQCYKPDLASLATPLRKSTGSDLDCGRRQPMEELEIRADKYLETDLDSVIPPMSSPPPRPPPPGEAFKLDVSDGAGPMPLRRPRSNIYEEPKEFRREITSVVSETEVDEDEAASSDDEPIYFNILQFKQQNLSLANALYTSASEVTSSGSSENEKSASEKRRLRRMAHHYEHIEPQLSKRLSVAPSSDYGKQHFSCYTCMILMCGKKLLTEYVKNICWFGIWH